MEFVGKQFDNAHIGHRGFVIGTGPSLKHIINNSFDLSVFSNEITVGCNHAYELFEPKYLVWSDHYFWKKFGYKVMEVNSIKFCADDVARRINQKLFNTYVFKRTGKATSDIPSSMTDIFTWWSNSGVLALRIAFILGLNPIYLLGIDLHKNDGRGNTHFHNAYDSYRLHRTSSKRYEAFNKVFVDTIKNLHKMGIKVYSCSRSSALNSLIEYVDIFDLFNFTKPTRGITVINQ